MTFEGVCGALPMQWPKCANFSVLPYYCNNILTSNSQLPEMLQ